MKRIISTALSLLMLAAVCHANASKPGEKSEIYKMNRIELTDKTFSELFNAERKPSRSDPELMDILQKFIFGEVFHTGVLDMKQRELITIVVLAVNQCQAQLKAHAGAALNIGVDPIEIREAVYSLSPIIGFPKVLNAIDAVNCVFKERGIELPLKNAATVKEEERLKTGREIQIPTYGDRTKELLDGLPDNSHYIHQFLSELCFGDFYTREGLDLRTRELLIFCGLAALGGAEYSMLSHACGNLKAGNSSELLVAAVIQCAPYMGFPRALNAAKAIKEACLKQQKEKNI